MKAKTTWNLGLLYKSEKDPQIEKDMRTIEKACDAFEKKYKGKDFTSTPEKLLKALEDNEKLKVIFDGSKPWWYFALKTTLNGADSKSEAESTKYEQRLTEASNKLIFFGLEISKIPKSKQTQFLKNKKLTPYKYLLQKMFDEAQYLLSEKEEQLVDLFSQTSYSMWVDGQERVLAGKTIKHKGQDLPLPQAINKLPDLSLADRRSIKKEIDQVLRENVSFATAELNAVYNYKKVIDKRRGYERPYSASVRSYENTDKEVDSLVKLVAEYFPMAHRFYKLHAKLLGMKKLKVEDRAVKIGKIERNFSFEEALKITGNAFEKVDPMYKEFLNQFAERGQFDVYPKKGKRGGAFCWGQGDNPTFVFLNQVDTIDSVETLGHEMGHAFHTELSKRQPPRYRKYALSTAETASMFFEQVTQHSLEENLSPREKIISLHNRLIGDMSGIFRQIACFNFELELHEFIRKNGQASHQEIAGLMRKHLGSYLGPAFEIIEDDGYFFVYWSHIRNFFYVYTYAYGQLVSRAMYQRWKEDPSFSKKVEQFLSAGRSMSPKDIFKSIGINTTDPKFFEAGLKGIEEDINKLEKLTKGWKLKA
jgi:oligoendopeptidase F